MAHETFLPVGTPAPDFAVQTWDGQPVSLSSCRGRKLWLAFFRHVNCPFCNVRLFQMRDFAKGIADRVHLVGVFQSPADRFRGSPAHAQAWFPMVADPEEKLYGLYGLGAGLGAILHPAVGVALVKGLLRGLPPTPPDGTFSRCPADFLITPTGTLADAFYGAHAADHIPLERVQAFADAA